MSDTSFILDKVLKDLLPPCVVSEVACFVFYDEHPGDERTIDITVCSHRGEVQEYYQREIVDSILLKNVNEVSEIQILRNGKCKLFYLVAAKDEVIILSKQEKLNIHQRISNVDVYEIEDLACRGQACLKIVKKDDAVPLVFDENFDELGERIMSFDNVKSEEALPLVNDLMKKLTEAKYTTKYNENILQEYLNLRQRAAFSIYNKMQPNLDNTVFKLNLSEIANALQMKTTVPIFKLCNKKIVIISSLLNKNPEPITDVSVLLHGTTTLSLSYTTKIFEQIPIPPHWKEKNSQIDSNKESTIVAIVDLKEIKDNVKSTIDFDMVISYTKQGKSYLLPLEGVKISAQDIMGDSFDILSDKEADNYTLILVVLATSERTDLCIRHIKNPGDGPDLQLLDIFCKYLQMETLGMYNIAIHKISPHHALYGLIIVFQDEIDSSHKKSIQVYSRTHSQVLALIQYMYHTIPYRMVTTTPEYSLTGLVKDLSIYNENEEQQTHLSYTDCGSSLLRQTLIIKEYFDNCMIAMSENKDVEIQNKLGLEIDLLAQGLPKYLEFRQRVLDESLNSIKSLSFQEHPVNDSDIITIED